METIRLLRVPMSNNGAIWISASSLLRAARHAFLFFLATFFFPLPFICRQQTNAPLYRCSTAHRLMT